MNIRQLYQWLLLGYLATTLYLYQFGITIGSEFALRVPDVFGSACIGLGLATLAITLQLGPRYRSLLPALPVITAEIVLPLVGTVAAGGGLGGISNSLRMLFLWGPPCLYIAIFADLSSDQNLRIGIRRLLTFSVIANLIYSIVQLLVKAGFAPQSLIVLNNLSALAIDDSFQPFIQGFRAQGFFINSTGLAVFGICCLSYFLASHYESRKIRDAAWSMLSALLVVLSLSRTGLIGIFAILATYLLFSNLRRATAFLIPFAVLAASAAVLIDRYFGLELLLSRVQVFLDLGTSGAYEDYSFAKRLYEHWPSTLEKLQNYPFGTLVSASTKFGVIDSGYLTYYAQGKWVFVAAFVWLLLVLIGRSVRNWFKGIKLSGELLALFLALYLMLGMVISNPMRNAVLVFLLSYALWQTDYERNTLKT